MPLLARQLPLLELPFAPMPERSEHYVPALLNWTGEREALRRASDETWSRMTPLIQVSPRGIAKKTDISLASISDWAKQIREAVGGHPIYLDTLGIDASKRTRPQTDRPVISALYEAARDHGLAFVPVIACGDRAASDAVAAANAQDQRGVAIRYRVGRDVVHAGADPAEDLADTLASLELTATRADLVVDLGYLAPQDDLSADDVSELLDQLLGQPWRNVILLATSVPASFADSVREGSLGSVPRREWDLWMELRGRRSERLAFGDYGVQHPRAPGSKGGGRMRVNVRYPTRDAILVARGVGAFQDLTHAERASQYRKCCHDLVMNASFLGRDCCHGDRLIQDCADGRIPPGSQSMWRAAGHSHNFRLATESLAELKPKRLAAALGPTRRSRTGIPTPIGSR